jgi:hydrogenase maturation protease
MITLVLGIGHPDRGDDAAGLLVADQLRETPHLVARSVEGDPSAILSDPLWDTADHVVIVDTVQTGAPPGTVFCWDAAEVLDLLSSTAVSVPNGGTHDLGVAATVRLAEALGRLPRDLTMVGIEGARFTCGAPPSHEVLAATERVAAALDVQVMLDAGGALGVSG